MPNHFQPGDDWSADNEAYGHSEDPVAHANAALRMAVNLALIEGGRVDTRAVSILADDGVVTLNGSVPAAQKAAVVAALKGVAGIKSVRDNLRAT